VNSEVQQSGKHVLLVDDNPNDLELALAALSGEDTAARIVTAQGGPAALAYLHAHSGADAQQASLVLLDLKMPQMDGLAVLEAIRADAQLRDIPVVMLTTSREHSDIQACYQRGADDYVVKPMDFEAFGETLRSTLSAWIGRPHRPASRPSGL